MPDDLYFTDDEAKDYLGDDRLGDLGEEDADEKIEAGRLIVESRFESICGVSFVPRSVTEKVRSDGATDLLLRPLAREIEDATVDGTTIDLSDVAVSPLGAFKVSGWPVGLIEVTYSHGFDEPPAEVRRAALRYLREVVGLTPSDDRAIRLDLESGSYQRAIAGRNRPTGIPDVDVVLDSYDYRTPFA